MIPLARKTLVHEWRRFLPSGLAVAFSGLLLLVQAALVFGIFNSSAVYIRKSGGELWLGYPGTQSIELGRPIPAQAEIAALMDPGVARVEPFNWIDGDWRGPADRGGVSVFVSGIDTRADGLMKRKSKLTIATAAAVLASLVGTAVYAQDKYSLKSPSGIAFSDFKGYEDWAVISSARTDEVLKVIVGNPTMSPTTDCISSPAWILFAKNLNKSAVRRNSFSQSGVKPRLPLD